MNSTASSTAPSKFAFNFCTSLLPEASDGFGPSSFFFTGAFGTPATGGVVALGSAATFSPSDSLTAATRDLACSTIAAFSASAPAASPALGMAGGGGVPASPGGTTTPGGSALGFSGLSLSSAIGFSLP